ncbi:MAG: pseudaminic acid synthase, partial [Epsilonproteobacteria bacterium]|nr:pseudaminic acid synthase [Campylobacterota bacterium]
LSANHANSLQIAKDTIYAAKEAGADAIKLQTYTPDWMTIDCKKEDFLIKSELWRGKNLYELYKEAQTPLSWHEELFSYAKELDIEIFSSPFSKEAVDFLELLNPIAYKIASFEITDYELIKYTASKKRAMIISTGAAYLNEIENVLSICKKEGCTDIALLKCTSSYPAPLSEANLSTIRDMKKRFGVEVGFSDHTLGITAPIVAVSLGARIIEKHFILDKNLNTPDKEFSLNPKEFKEMVKAIRESEELLGEVKYGPSKSAREFTRSLYAIRDIKKEERFSEENIKAIRPGYGLHPKYLPDLLEKRAKRDYQKGEPISKEELD